LAELSAQVAKGRTEVLELSRKIERESEKKLPKKRSGPTSDGTEAGSKVNENAPSASLGRKNDGTATGRPVTVNSSSAPPGKKPKLNIEPPNSTALLKFSAAGEAAGGGSSKGITLSSVLFNFWNEGLLKRKKNKSVLSGMRLMCLSEPDKLRFAMQLVEFVMDDEQWRALSAYELSKNDALKITNEVERLATKKLREWEREVGIVKADKKNDKTKGFYIGVGRRVKAYKVRQNIGQMEALRAPKSGLLAQGARSIKKFFTSKDAAVSPKKNSMKSPQKNHSMNTRKSD